MVLAAFAAADSPASSSTRLTLSPCTVPGVSGQARCGTFSVYENRATRRGRKIALKVVVLPATGPDRMADPIVWFAGGPGGSATEDAAGLAASVKDMLRRRDLVLIDQRGTGGSHPLHCVLFRPPEDPQSYLGDFFPESAVRDCRRELERDADLTQYTTSIAMDDIDDVRAALGYPRVNLLGGSYGTRAALVYIRGHAARVRTAILVGAVPTSIRMPLAFPRTAQRALDGVLGDCAMDPECRAAFPNVRTEARAVLDQLSESPARVEIRDRLSGSAKTVTLSRDLAAEAIRYMMYDPSSADQLPAVLHQASLGNLNPLAERALFSRREMVAGGSNGMYLSVTCAEDVPWIAPGEGERAAAGTFLGDYRLRQQRAACSLWPRGKVPAGYARPVHGKTPVLIVSGAWDPVTPPSDGSAVAKSLSRSLHVIVPHGGHGFEGLEGAECLDQLFGEFVDRGTTRGLDTACVGRIKRKGFALTPAPIEP
jgi:pimeloyl-ACP methyl ester carboxylesterase